MLDLLLEWLRKRYFESARIGMETFPYTVEMGPHATYRRGREMAFYCASSLIARHRADRDEQWFRRVFAIHNVVMLYLDDGQFARGYNEAADEIRAWLAEHP